jgi:hypothetical protein
MQSNKKGSSIVFVVWMMRNRLTYCFCYVSLNRVLFLLNFFLAISPLLLLQQRNWNSGQRSGRKSSRDQVRKEDNTKKDGKASEGRLGFVRTRYAGNIIEWNWMELNGIEWNWMELNGVEWNWMELNGIEWSWMELNGVEWSWMELNGIEWSWIGIKSEMSFFASNYLWEGFTTGRDL